MACESAYRADDNKLHTSSRHGYIHTPQVAKKPDIAFFIASDERYYDDVTLLTLKSIHSVDRY